MAASQYDFKIEQGSSFRMSLIYKDSNSNAIDLANYCARLVWKTNTNVTQTFTTENSDYSTYKLFIETPTTDGKITFLLPASTTNGYGFSSAKYDLARYGMEVFRASPRQADLMIVAGRVSQKMAPVLRQVYDQMADPKWVIAMGACSSTGGMFNNYALVQGVDHIVPVDIYVPGCPPGPQSLMHGILTLHDKIMDGEINR